MDLLTQLATALKIAEDAYTMATALYKAVQEKGDPTPQEVTDQIARAKSANDEFHQLAGV